MDNQLFYVDVLNNSYDFYYNMAAELQENVVRAVGQAINLRPLNEASIQRRFEEYGGGFAKRFQESRHFGVIGSRENSITGDIEYMMADLMQGITASVSAELAQYVLSLAKYYCPTKTGRLRDSGRIEQQADGTCRIFFDCEYAWYVHEFSWLKHDFPTCDHFLTRAIYEVGQMTGLGWI